MRSIYRAAAFTLTLGMAILLPATAIAPAESSYFKNQYFPEAYEYSLYSSPRLVNCTPPGLTVTELTGTDYVVVAPGDVINVSLKETDPHLNWEFRGGSGVRYLGNGLLETYPVRHLFTFKANESCAVRFEMVDDRDGKAIKSFEIRLAVVPPLTGLRWPALSPGLAPAFAWPVRLKFGA